MTSPLHYFLEQRIQKLLDTPPETTAPAKEKAKYTQRLRQARLRLARAKGSHTTEQWEAIVAETDGICVRCGYQHDLNFEKPCKCYIKPIAAGGSNSADNLMPLCRSCALSQAGELINWLAVWRKNKAAYTP